MFRTWWRKITGWEHLGLAILVLLTLVIHLSIVTQVNDLIFDEQHYVKDARLILSGQGDERPEHPPLSKLFIAAGMSIFGDNPLGWRIMSIVAGTLCIIILYAICKRLDMSAETALIAAFLFGLENLSFIQASIAMLDVFYVLFLFCSFLLYLNRRFILSGAYVALSALGKLLGALALPVVFAHWLWTRKVRIDHVLLLGVISALAFGALLPVFIFVITRQWQNPIDQIKTMLSLSGSLTFTANYSDVLTRPWQWVLQPTFMWYWYDPHYMGAISFDLWALIIPAVGYMVFRAVKGNNAAKFGLCWFFGTYLLWIPLGIFTDRISFIFYFYPTVGAICIGLALAMGRLLDVWRSHVSRRLRRFSGTVVYGYLVIHTLVFIILAPVFSRWTFFIRP